MTPSQKKICLITPGHLSSTPRLVREANCLHEAGYRVVVVAGCYHAPSIQLDKTILKNAPWEYHGVRLSGLDRLNLKLIEWSNRLLRRLGMNLGLEAEFLTLHPFSSLLLSQVLEVGRGCQLFIGHTMPGLYAAVEASRLRNAEAGFDIEDYHPDESVASPGKRHLISKALETWLPRCAHLTAASPLIGEICTKNFHINPAVVLNTYSITDAPESQPDETFTTSFYWFSQTIGPGRGLEGFIDVINHLETPAHLVLRGFITPAYGQQLRERLLTGPGHSLEILEPCGPAEVVRSCAGYSFGLCLEQSSPANRDLCLTNKLFAYLLAGTPVILSSTRAHRQMAPELGDAALLIDFSQDPRAIAKLLDSRLTHGNPKGRGHAWMLGQRHYHWEAAQSRWLQGIHSLLNHE